MINYREEVITAFKRPIGSCESAAKLKSLTILESKGAFVGWKIIKLPDWAIDIAPAGYDGLMVPVWQDSMAMEWKRYDWWRAAHFMITSGWERSHELKNGPVHSYAFKYDAKYAALFEHAWANRIILFLKRWWTVQNDVADEQQAFGPVVKPIIHLTHDVDAISKTIPIRVKQAAFWVYNRSVLRALKFLVSPADYWQFNIIMAIEKAFGHTSTWNIYGGKGGWLRSPRKILLDPSYCVLGERLRNQLKLMSDKGHTIGLHQSFDAWQTPELMQQEKETIEAALGQEVKTCRQHWLRFSFTHTWKAQARAGLNTDMTLGFNDRAGFRNSSAISVIDKQSGIKVIPMVLMDSHLYDYANLNEQERDQKMDHILKELQQAGGEASIIWHHRVFHSDYGWGSGYYRLLNKMNEMGFLTA